MKRLLVVSLLALASLVLVPSALSDPPTIFRTSGEATYFDDVDCGFPVQIDIFGDSITIVSASGDRAFGAFQSSTTADDSPVSWRSMTSWSISRPYWSTSRES